MLVRDRARTIYFVDWQPPKMGFVYVNDGGETDSAKARLAIIYHPRRGSPPRGRNSRSPLFYKNFMGRDIRYERDRGAYPALPCPTLPCFVSPRLTSPCHALSLRFTRNKTGFAVIREIRTSDSVYRKRENLSAVAFVRNIEYPSFVFPVSFVAFQDEIAFVH